MICRLHAVDAGKLCTIWSELEGLGTRSADDV